MSQEKRSRREAARAAAGPNDGLTFLSTQDGKSYAAAAETEAAETIAAREHVGKQFLAYLGSDPFTIDALKLFIRTDCESYAATTMWTRRSHLLKFLLTNFWVGVAPTELSATNAMLSANSKKHSKKKASVFTIEEVLSYLREAPSEGQSLRNKLALLFGVFSLGRMQEVSKLTWADIQNDLKREAYLFTLTRSKTAVDGARQTFFLPYMFYDIDTRPLIEAYRTLSVPVGIIWVRVNSKKQLGKGTLAETPKYVAEFLKLTDPKQYTGHGLRATGATAMADHGCTELELMLAGNWKSLTVARSYVRQSIASGRRRMDLIMGSEYGPAQAAPAPTTMSGFIAGAAAPAAAAAPELLDRAPPMKRPALDMPGLLQTIFSNCTFSSSVNITINN